MVEKRQFKRMRALRKERDYNNILLAMAVFLATALAKSWQFYYIIGILFIISAVFLLFLFLQPHNGSFARYLSNLGLASRGCTPLLLGALSVALYYNLYHLQNVFGYDVDKYIGYNIPKLLELARFNPSYKEQFYTALATLFSIIVALTLVKCMEESNNYSANLASEADSLRSIWNYLKYFQNKKLDDAADHQEMGDAIVKIRRVIRSYVSDMAQHELLDTDLTSNDVASRLRKYTLQFKAADKDDEIAQERIIDAVENISKCRSKRASARGGGVPFYLKFALWLMSIALVLPFFAEPLCVFPSSETPILLTCEKDLNPQRWSQYYMIFTIVSFFSFLLLMIDDINTFRIGFFKTRNGVFRDLRNYIGAPNARRVKRRKRRFLQQGADIGGGRIASSTTVTVAPK